MKNRLFGIGEPVVTREIQDNIPVELSLNIIDAIGFGSWREWMHLNEVLIDPFTVDPDKSKRFTKVLNLAAELDIEVTGMNHTRFLPEGCRDRSGCSVPRRDLTPGSLYMQMLDMLEQSWCTMTATFPQVSMWEVGNEWNVDTFLHVDGYLQDGMLEKLTLDEKADISLDLMYWSAKGIRRGNPETKVVMASPTLCQDNLPFYVSSGYGIAMFLEKLYSRISSGNYWSKCTDDYFDMAAWHPYQFGPEGQGTLWAEINDAAYRVMEKYGDGHKKVLLTEFGYTDWGNPELEKEHAKWYKKIFEICAERSYIYTVHIFRLFEDFRADGERKSASWGGPNEVYFGIFREPENGLTPRAKAIELQKLTGGTGDLWKFQ